MMPHKYSMNEIDSMRISVRRMCNEPGIKYDTEAMLQTYMMNGTTVEELHQHANKAEEEARHRYDDAARQWRARTTL